MRAIQSQREQMALPKFASVSDAIAVLDDLEYKIRETDLGVSGSQLSATQVDGVLLRLDSVKRGLEGPGFDSREALGDVEWIWDRCNEIVWHVDHTGLNSTAQRAVDEIRELAYSEHGDDL